MNLQFWNEYIVTGLGMVFSWAIWVSVSIFKHTQEIALLKQEIKMMGKVQEVLEEICDTIKKEHKC